MAAVDSWVPSRCLRWQCYQGRCRQSSSTLAIRANSVVKQFTVEQISSGWLLQHELGVEPSPKTSHNRVSGGRHSCKKEKRCDLACLDRIALDHQFTRVLKPAQTINICSEPVNSAMTPSPPHVGAFLLGTAAALEPVLRSWFCFFLEFVYLDLVTAVTTITYTLYSVCRNSWRFAHRVSSVTNRPGCSSLAGFLFRIITMKLCLTHELNITERACQWMSCITVIVGGQICRVCVAILLCNRFIAA